MSDPLPGEAAIAALGTQLPAVAQAHGLQPQALTALLRTQRGLRVDPDGALLFLCEPPAASLAAAATSATTDDPAAALAPSEGDPFRLHSFPGSSRVIYLDFTGHTTTGTQWNSRFTGGAAIVSAPFDTDGNPASFGAAEQTLIRRIWQRVAEDYAPFAIDVTTEDPGLEALRRSSTSDDAYGIRVVISPTNWYSGSAGGVGYVGSFNWSSDTPCFAFSDQLLQSEKFIAESAAHEAGHTLGLYHDGLGGSSPTEYYSGQGNWAPIMGASYYKPVTAFSRGEYQNASNKEDDLATISTFAPYASDDHGNTLGGASALSGPTVSDGGTIERSGDVDVFRFVSGAGNVALNIAGPSPEPNLDIQAELLDANGQVLQSSNPSSLNASISASVAGGTYYLRITGVGAGDPVTSGYSNYGSLGNYVITGALGTSTNQPPVAVASASKSSGPAPLTVAFSSQGSFDADGSIASYAWDFGDGNNSSAANPNHTYNTPGFFSARLRVTDNVGQTANSSLLGINVQAPTNGGTAPVMTLQPLSQTAAPGSTVILTAAASGDPAPTYQWWRNGVTFSSWTGPTLALYGLSSNDQASYTVVASNSAGSVTSAAAYITVSSTLLVNSAPVFTTQPISRSVNAGESVTLSGAASGVPTPSYQWTKNGIAVPGATNATLQLTAVTTAESGNYTLIASNSAGSATSNIATVTVNSPSGSAPVFTTQPLSQTATAGGTVFLTATASGSPAPTYQWWRNGVTFSSWNTSTLALYGLSSNDVGTYTVVATNSAGSVTSVGAVVSIGTTSSTNVAPVFTTQPLSQVATPGSTVTLTAAASGSPTPTYQWRRNGVVNPSWTGPTLTLPDVTSNDQGTYTVVATNAAGSATSVGAVLTVGSTSSSDTAPVFTIQPNSQVVTAGSTVLLTAAASGSPSPTYRWWRNGVTFSSWTGPTLTLYGFSANDEATYTVVATNSAGSATSNGAVVTIGSTSSTNVAPVFTLQPKSQVVTAGSTVYLTAAASGSPAPTYQWRRNGVAYSSWTSPTLTLYGVSSNDQATYTVVATNSAGSTTSASATLSVSSGVATASQITLAWNDNSVDETSFKIERAPAGLAFTEVATVGANVTQFTDTNVTPSTSYSYRVRASNANGDSAYTNVTTVTAPAAASTALVTSAPSDTSHSD